MDSRTRDSLPRRDSIPVKDNARRDSSGHRRSIAGHSWYHGRIDRKTAEKLLEETERGTFLLRDRSTESGEFVLSVSAGSTSSSPFTHFIVTFDNGLFHLLQQNFPSLDNMIQYYQQNFLPCKFSLASPVIVPVPSRRTSSVDPMAFPPVGEQPLLNRRDSVINDSTQREMALALRERTINAYDATALSFDAGDIVTVYEQNINGTWFGECHGKHGHFPLTFVELINKPISM